MSAEARCLRDFVSLQRGTTYKGDLVGLPGPVLLGLASIQANGGFRYGGFKTYGGDCPEKILLKSGDIYVSLKDVTQSGDLLGSVSRVPPDIPSGRLTQDTVKLVFNGAPISREFLYWVLRTPNYREYCRGCATGTTTLGLARDDFLNFLVPDPSEADLLLVDLLDGIEKRIVVLRETNATLEAIAQALFKSWFVDFDPVLAKQQGRALEGLDEPAIDFFSMTAEPWPRKRVADLVVAGALQIGDGYRAKNVELGFPGIPFVRAGDLDDGRITPTRDHLMRGPENKIKDKSAKAGDTVFTSKGTIGRFAFVGANAGEAVYSPQVCFWRALNSIALTPEYLHFWMRSDSFGSQVNAVRGQAAIMDFVSLTSQRAMWIDLPPIGLQIAFSKIVGTLLERISSNRETTDTLAALRDTLLPRLISGQLRLPDVEAMLEASA